MDMPEVNQCLASGMTDVPGLFPHLDRLARETVTFDVDFGLTELPTEPGVLLIRVARQYGKSTWLEQQAKGTVEEHGPGSAYYLNGDDIRDAERLRTEISALADMFRRDATVRRLFVDEIRAVTDWEHALKRAIDRGELDDVLVVTTGSKAIDLRHGTERLPGRKGRLDRTTYYFTPIPFREFRRVCGERLGDDCLPAYMLSGGSPVACRELAEAGRIPEYVIEMTRDWVYGEFARKGRRRASLLAVMECLHRFGGTPVGQAKLAREPGLANNTVAAQYVDLLTDLLYATPALQWDGARGRPDSRKPCKFHFINLLAAAAWHPARPRSVPEFQTMSAERQGQIVEWVGGPGTLASGLCPRRRDTGTALLLAQFAAGTGLCARSRSIHRGKAGSCRPYGIPLVPAGLPLRTAHRGRGGYV